MRLLGNLIWLLLGGILIAVEYIISSLLLCITIVGIPFGIQTMKLGVLALWPFGRDVQSTEGSTGCLSTLMNLLWICIGGIWIAATHLGFGIILGITIIGIPFARQHFKLAALSLIPFGREIVRKE